VSVARSVLTIDDLRTRGGGNGGKSVRSEKVRCTLGLSLFVVLVAPQLVAQDRSGANREQTHYIVKALSTLGGTQSVGEAITERGWISGAANLDPERRPVSRA
jgi:hypothetical protein